MLITWSTHVYYFREKFPSASGNCSRQVCIKAKDLVFINIRAKMVQNVLAVWIL